MERGVNKKDDGAGEKMLDKNAVDDLDVKKIIIAISRRYLRKKKIFERDEKNIKNINENEAENMQAEHETHVTKIIYI